jgi:hypothetical protein
MVQEFLDSRPIQFFGKFTFLASLITATTNLIANMEIFNHVVVVISAVIGLPFAYYKLKVIHHDYVERKEKRKAEGKKPIEFRWNLLSWLKKKKK